MVALAACAPQSSPDMGGKDAGFAQDLSSADLALDAGADLGAGDIGVEPGADLGVDLGVDLGAEDLGSPDVPSLDLGGDGGAQDLGLAPDVGADLGVDQGADLGADAGADTGSADLGSVGDGGFDLGAVDMGSDLGFDAGAPLDTGVDLGVDLGADLGADAGADQGADAGLIDQGTPGTFGATGFQLGAPQGYAGGGEDRLYGVATDSLGRVVAAGYSRVGPGAARALLVRYTPDGALDLSFGGDGVVLGVNDGAQTVFWGLDNRFLDVAVDPLDRIVVVGRSGDANVGYQTVVARYSPNGQLDTSFGDPTPTGRAGFTLGAGGSPFSGFFGSPDERLSAVELDSAGRIVAAGIAAETSQAYFYRTLVARFTSDGALDPSFSTDGYHVGSPSGGNWFTGAYDEYFDVTVGPQDEVIAAGWVANPNFGVERTLVVRFTASGDFSPTFNASGTPGYVMGPATSRLGGTKEVSTAVVVDALGNLVVTGFCFDASNIIRTFIERYLPSGAFDLSFNGTGWALGLPSIINQAAEYPRAVIVDSQGRAVIAGFSDDSGAAGDNVDRAFLRRYTPAGADDGSFNLTLMPLSSAIDSATGGVSEFGGGLADGFLRVAPAPADGIYAAGTSAGRTLVVRYRADGCLDAPGPCAN